MLIICIPIVQAGHIIAETQLSKVTEKQIKRGKPSWVMEQLIQRRTPPSTGVSQSHFA